MNWMGVSTVLRTPTRLAGHSTSAFFTRGTPVWQGLQCTKGVQPNRVQGTPQCAHVLAGTPAAIARGGRHFATA